MRFLSTTMRAATLAALIAGSTAQGVVAQAAPGEPPPLRFNWPDEEREAGKSYVFSGMSYVANGDGTHGSAVFFGAGTEVEIGDNIRIRIEFVTERGDRMAF